MPTAFQDLPAPGFLQNGPKSLDALGKKRHSQMEESLLVPATGRARGSLKPQHPLLLVHSSPGAT